MATKFNHDIYCSCDYSTTTLKSIDEILECLKRKYEFSILKNNCGRSVEESIKDAKIMLCFLTQKYCRSRAFSNEVNIACDLGRTVIYILLEPMDISTLSVKNNQILNTGLVFEYYYQKNLTELQKICDFIERTLKQSCGNFKIHFDFFMSHQKSCKAIILEIVDLLTVRGYKSWLDKDQLYIGDELHAKLAEGILDSEYFICFLSKLYIESYNCELEYKFALSKRKPALFILLEELEIPPGLAFYMSNSMRLDAYKKSGNLNCLNDESKRKLLESIKRLKRNKTFIELNEEASELLKVSTKIRDASRSLKNDREQMLTNREQILNNMHETIENHNEEIDKHKSEIFDFKYSLSIEETQAAESYKVSKVYYDSDINALYEKKKLALESLQDILRDREDLTRKEDELTQSLAALEEDQMKNMQEQYDLDLLIMSKGSKMLKAEASKMDREYLDKKIKTKEQQLERLSKQIKFIREKQRQIAREIDSIEEAIKNCVPKVVRANEMKTTRHKPDEPVEKEESDSTEEIFEDCLDEIKPPENAYGEKIVEKILNAINENENYSENSFKSSKPLEKASKPFRDEKALCMTLEGHKGVVRCLFESRSGKIFSGSDDHTIKVWDLKQGECLKTIRGNKDVVSFLLEIETGEILSVCYNKIRVWDAMQGVCLRTLGKHKSSVSCLLESKSGFILSGSRDHTIKVWDVNKPECLNTLYGHEDSISCLLETKSGEILSASGSIIKVWDIRNGLCLKSLVVRDLFVSCLLESKHGEILSGYQGGKIKIWDRRKGVSVKTLRGHTDTINCLIESDKTGLILSASGDSTIKTWTRNNSDCLNTLVGHISRIQCLLESKSGLLLSGSIDKTIKVWDISKGECLKTLEGHIDWILCLLESKSGEILSAGSDYRINVWNINKLNFI